MGDRGRANGRGIRIIIFVVFIKLQRIQFKTLATFIVYNYVMTNACNYWRIYRDLRLNSGNTIVTFMLLHVHCMANARGLGLELGLGLGLVGNPLSSRLDG